LWLPFFFEFSPGEGENPPPQFVFSCLKAYAAYARWIQVNQSLQRGLRGAEKETTHTNTQHTRKRKKGREVTLRKEAPEANAWREESTAGVADNPDQPSPN
jgi:hypothetical protein